MSRWLAKLPLGTRRWLSPFVAFRRKPRYLAGYLLKRAQREVRHRRLLFWQDRLVVDVASGATPKVSPAAAGFRRALCPDWMEWVDDCQGRHQWHAVGQERQPSGTSVCWCVRCGVSLPEDDRSGALVCADDEHSWLTLMDFNKNESVAVEWWCERPGCNAYGLIDDEDPPEGSQHVPEARHVHRPVSNAEFVRLLKLLKVFERDPPRSEPF